MSKKNKTESEFRSDSSTPIEIAQKLVDFLSEQEISYVCGMMSLLLVSISFTPHMVKQIEEKDIKGISIETEKKLLELGEFFEEQRKWVN